MINSTVSLGKELIPFFPWQLWKLASLNSRSIHLVTLKFPLQNILKLLSLNPILFMVKKAKNSIQFFFFIKNYSLHIFVYMTMSQSTKFTKTNLFYITLQHTIKKNIQKIYAKSSQSLRQIFFNGAHYSQGNKKWHKN